MSSNTESCKQSDDNGHTPINHRSTSQARMLHSNRPSNRRAERGHSWAYDSTRFDTLVKYYLLKPRYSTLISPHEPSDSLLMRLASATLGPHSLEIVDPDSSLSWTNTTLIFTTYTIYHDPVDTNAKNVL